MDAENFPNRRDRDGKLQASFSVLQPWPDTFELEANQMGPADVGVVEFRRLSRSCSGAHANFQNQECD